MFFFQELFLDLTYELIAPDYALAYDLVINSLPLCHFLDKGFPICPPGFVRFSSIIGKDQIISDEVLHFPFAQIPLQTAPRVACKALIFFPRFNLLQGLDPDRI